MDQSTPDATDFELAAASAKALDLCNEDVISLSMHLVYLKSYKHYNRHKNIRLHRGADYININTMQKLKIYGLYKQATQGDNDKPEPSSINMVAHAKWYGYMYCFTL